MTPRQLSQQAKIISCGLGLKDRFLMTYRPRICPFHVLMEYVRLGSSLLDIGCGCGLWLFLLARLGRIKAGIGIETEPSRVKIAESVKTSKDNLDFIAATPDDAWPQDGYDCITMIDVLHHVSPDNQKEFLGRLKNCSASRIIFKDIDPAAKIKSSMNSLHDIVLSKQLPRYCTKEKAAACLENMGFEIIHIARYDMLWYSHYLIVADRKN